MLLNSAHSRPSAAHPSPPSILAVTPRSDNQYADAARSERLVSNAQRATITRVDTAQQSGVASATSDGTLSQETTTALPRYPVRILRNWQYAIAYGPITIQVAGQTPIVLATGTEFLQFLRPHNGLWFMVTLDGTRWGWGCVTGPQGPGWIRMEPKFDTALQRVRMLNEAAALPSRVVYPNEAPGQAPSQPQENNNDWASVESIRRRLLNDSNDGAPGAWRPQ